MVQFVIPYNIIYKALGETYFPARMEVISKKPLVILDGAHNPDGAKALSKALKEYNGKATALIGMMKDKDCEEVLKTTLPYCKNAVAVTVDNMPRALLKENLKTMAETVVTRYSDAELAEFKALILEKLEVARSDYEQLRASITRSADNDTEDTSPTFKVLEEGAMTLSKEEIERLAAHQLKFIKNLELALIRIEHKTYGICKTTGKLIPRERLLRVPHATECIEAKEARK